ncbi:hypothetical protein A2U01_0035558, partial [Trifolium medium]|nr:hypothetical protein [Trifolium medium]
RYPKLVGTVEVPSGFIPTLLIPSVAPSSLPPKQNTLTPLISVVEDCNHVLEDVQFKDADETIETICSSGRICDGGSKTSKGDNIVDDVTSDSIPRLLITMPSENSGFIPSFKDADESIEARLSSDRILDDGSKPSRGDNIVDNVPSGFMLSDNYVEDVEFKDDANENQEALLNM